MGGARGVRDRWRTDFDFLSRIFDKLLINFTWWVNREDADGSNLFEGGFLGLDNIGPLDRSHLPVGGTLGAVRRDRLDGVLRPQHGHHGRRSCNRSGQRPCADLVLKFLEHFAGIRDAMETQALWDEDDGLFYDRLATPDGRRPGQGALDGRRSFPLLAAVVLDEQMLHAVADLGKRFAGFLERIGLRRSEELQPSGLVRGEARQRQLLLGVVGAIELWCSSSASCSTQREFLSPHGLRAISAYHREHPYVLEVEGMRATIDYEPAESTTDMFGGNSNWRGPIWFPLNYLLVERARAVPPLLRRRA